MCTLTESIKMSLNVTQDVPQQHVLDRHDQHLMILIRLRPQCGRNSQLGFLNLFLVQGDCHG